MKIWCFDDMGKWGEGLFLAARAAGHDPVMFDNPEIPHDGVALMHMHDHPGVRILHKRMMQDMSTKPDLTLIPNYRASDLFDDKMAQARHLSKWMPRTRVFYNPPTARSFAESDAARYPIYSKTSEGSNGYNVRVLHDKDMAKDEIRAAFDAMGLKARYSKKQIGYLLWQDPVPGNKYEYRIVNVGRHKMLIKRFPKKNGFEHFEPVTTMSDEVASVLRFATAFFDGERFPFGIIDVLRDHDANRWVMLELSVHFNIGNFRGSNWFDGAHALTTFTGADIWKVMVKEIEAGRMGQTQTVAA